MDNIAQYPIYFAPGCKLLKEQPELAHRIYDYLCQLFGHVQLYTRCCRYGGETADLGTAVLITVCPSCLSVYGDNTNLIMRDFWTIYDEYKDYVPLQDT